MNITVLGLWHLGCVTAACCAERFPNVRGLDFDLVLIAQLQQGRPPISEPGLTELLQAGLRAGSLSFSADAEAACRDADVLWVCDDTPVDEEDRADVEFVITRLRQCLPHLRAGTVVVISSQMPAGTCRRLSAEYPQVFFACVPENLQLGRALEAFRRADRLVIGVRDAAARDTLETLCRPFSQNLIFMSPESAEMTKHALNGFLALSVSYINEVARICERVGADASEVEAGLKSDPRIGPRAYLKPGPAFAGGTLARDVAQMMNLGQAFDEPLRLIPAIKQSNDQHKQWAWENLARLLGSTRDKTVAVLGLTYKPLTDTLRRSSALELCRRLLEAGAVVRAFDPAIRELPPEWRQVQLAGSAEAACREADAAVLCTPWPEFRQFDWPSCLRGMRRPMLLDAQSFAREQVRGLPMEYYSVGRKT